jgi:hypothetical protein
MLTCSLHEPLVFAGLGALLVTCGCTLGEAEVVTRSPDLGPPITGLLGQDGSSINLDSPDVSDSEPLPSEGITLVRDARDTAGARPDASIATDGADTAGIASDAIGADGANAGEAGDECSAQGFVFCDDFEDGAAGWIWTGETWEVTRDTMSTQPNAVFSPSAPGASSARLASGIWQDMTVEVRVRVTSFGPASSSNRAEVYARYQDSGHFYAVSWRADGKLGLRRNSSGFGAIASVTVAEKEWHTLKIKVSGPTDAVAVEGYLDGTLLTTATDTGLSLSGTVGTAGVGVYGETLAVFDDVKVSSP